MRHRFPFFAVLAAAAPDPTTAPPTARTETTRHAPKGVVPAGRRHPAPVLEYVVGV